MEKQNLEELQSELVEKEKISQAMHAGLAAFSFTCLLRLVTLPSDSLLVIISSCLFTVSSAAFLQIVISKYHVLHQVKSIHIGHVLVSEDSLKHPQLIGSICLVLGFLLMLLYISVFTCIIGIVALYFSSKHQGKFRK